MSKKTLTIIAMIVVIAALAGVLFLLNQEPVKEEPSAEAPLQTQKTVYLLGDAARKSVSQIEIENESGAFTIINTGQAENADYTLQGFEDLPLIHYELYSLGGYASSLAAKTLVVNKADHPGLYGFDKPRAKITAHYLDGPSATLLIGNAAAGNEGSYAMRQGDDAVYLVDHSYISNFLKKDFDFLDTTIYPAITTQDAAYAFLRAELGGTFREEPIVVEQTPETTLSAGGMLLDTHSIIAPVSARLSGDEGIDALSSVFGLSALSVEAVITDPEAELPEFGLDNPYSTLTLQMPSDYESVSLLASKPQEDGTVFLMREGVALVYRVSVESLPWLEISLFEMMDSMILYPPINSVDTVAIKTAEATHTFTLTGEGQEMRVLLDGKNDVSLTNFKQFYQTLITAKYTGETDRTTSPDGEPVLTMIYFYRDGGPSDMVRFYPAPARKTLIQRNDGLFYYGLSSYADRVIADLDKIVKGEEVKAYL